METEQHLLQRLKTNDRQAGKTLYERYAGRAMAVAMRVVADDEAARDVLQEAFVKILTHIDAFDYRGEGSLGSWMMRVVSNEAVNWVKRRRRLDLSGDLPVEDLPDEEPDVGSLPLEVLQDMIRQLPDGYRLVFCLYVFDGMTHKQIAHRLGIKQDSSASQFLRARRLLAKMINNYKKRQQT